MIPLVLATIMMTIEPPADVDVEYAEHRQCALANAPEPIVKRPSQYTVIAQIIPQPPKVAARMPACLSAMLCSIPSPKIDWRMPERQTSTGENSCESTSANVLNREGNTITITSRLRKTCTRHRSSDSPMPLVHSRKTSPTATASLDKPVIREFQVGNTESSQIMSPWQHAMVASPIKYERDRFGARLTVLIPQLSTVDEYSSSVVTREFSQTSESAGPWSASMRLENDLFLGEAALRALPTNVLCFYSVTEQSVGTSIALAIDNRLGDKHKLFYRIRARFPIEPGETCSTPARLGLQVSKDGNECLVEVSIAATELTQLRITLERRGQSDVQRLLSPSGTQIELFSTDVEKLAERLGADGADTIPDIVVQTWNKTPVKDPTVEKCVDDARKIRKQLDTSGFRDSEKIEKMVGIIAYTRMVRCLSELALDTDNERLTFGYAATTWAIMMILYDFYESEPEIRSAVVKTMTDARNANTNSRIISYFYFMITMNDKNRAQSWNGVFGEPSFPSKIEPMIKTFRTQTELTQSESEPEKAESLKRRESELLRILENNTDKIQNIKPAEKSQ